MKEWTHRCCERCWFDGNERFEKRGEEYELVNVEPVQGQVDGFRMPTQVVEVEPAPCCFCGGMTITGIFTRRDEREVLCKGRHQPKQYGQWSRVSIGD